MEANNALQEVMVAPSLSKANQTAIAEDMISQVVNGNVDPMKAYIQVKAIAEVCEQFLKSEEIVGLTLGAVTRSGKDLPAFNGAKVALANTTRYDYESTRDPEYISLVQQKNHISTKMKARELFLKSLESEIDVVDRESGAMITIFPPAKTQSKTLRVTFAKQ